MSANNILKGEFFENKTQTKIVTDNDDTYVCVSAIGTATDEPRWAITYIDGDGNVMYPVDGDGYPQYALMFKADDALSLTYSYSKI